MGFTKTVFFVIELDSLFQVLHDIEYVFGKTSDSEYKGLRQVICFCCQTMYSTIHGQLFPWLRVSWHCLFSSNPNLFQIWLLCNKVPSKLCCTSLILTTGKNEKRIKTICSSQEPYRGVCLCCFWFIKVFPRLRSVVGLLLSILIIACWISVLEKNWLTSILAFSLLFNIWT